MSEITSLISQEKIDEARQAFEKIMDHVKNTAARIVLGADLTVEDMDFRSRINSDLDGKFESEMTSLNRLKETLEKKKCDYLRSMDLMTVVGTAFSKSRNTILEQVYGHLLFAGADLGVLIESQTLLLIRNGIIERIKAEILVVFQNNFSNDFEDAGELDAAIDSSFIEYRKNKSDAIAKIIFDNRDTIVRAMTEIAKTSFFEKIPSLLEKYDNDDKIIDKLTNRFGHNCWGRFLNNFRLWLNLPYEDGQTTRIYTQEDDAPDPSASLKDSETGKEILGQCSSTTTWGDFFRDADESLNTLTPPKKGLHDFEDEDLNKFNFYLLPSFIFLARKGYNVRYLIV